MYCGKCGTKNNDDAKFCKNCGAPLAKKAIESYTQAVELALEGDERGFSYLYEETYKSKYYLALKYMDDKDAAEDVLQDSYIKAFSKLDSLKEPETFPSWLGTIVANTAKNALQKKNPVLFTDLPSGEEDSDLPDFEIEDESVESQPEAAYTQQETKELVNEMISSLSEEQKMCILMYYIDGESVRDIAESLDCTESAVKSRLSYGRKNLKAKAEELQKKGYKLFTLAPIPLLLALVHKDAEAAVCEKEFISAGRRIAKVVLKKAPHIAKTAAVSQTGGTGAAAHQAGTGAAAKAAAGAGAAGKGGAGAGAVVGFINTTVGKVVIVVIVAVVVIGSIGGGVHAHRVNQSKEVAAVYEDGFEPEELPEQNEVDVDAEVEDDAEVGFDAEFVPYFVENDIEILPPGTITVVAAASDTNSNYVTGTVTFNVLINTVESDEEGYSDTTITCYMTGYDFGSFSVRRIHLAGTLYDYYTGREYKNDNVELSSDGITENQYETSISMPDGKVYSLTVQEKQTSSQRTFSIHHPTEYDGMVLGLEDVTAESAENDSNGSDEDEGYSYALETIEELEESGRNAYWIMNPVK